MKRLLAILALVLLLSAIPAAAVYFGVISLRSGGEDGEQAVAGPAGQKGQPSARKVAEGPVRKPPPVEGLVLRTERPKGKEIRIRDEWTAARNMYEVKAGDSLYDIALARYGDASYVEDIRHANPGLTDRIRPGQRIRMPAKQRRQSAGRRERTLTPRVYTVQRGDTLIRIARRYYGDSAMYTKIFEMNRHQLRAPESIREGMVLQMPPQPQFDE
ncbi:MAG: LysM peptidoglycan-binding domain-containing protein [Anaerolineaceae bacterium]|nr:LysM peptidoglycan-binding domain-containing protein [Anaerolineaceae bacterium]